MTNEKAIDAAGVLVEQLHSKAVEIAKKINDRHKLIDRERVSARDVLGDIVRYTAAAQRVAAKIKRKRRKPSHAKSPRRRAAS